MLIFFAIRTVKAGWCGVVVQERSRSNGDCTSTCFHLQYSHSRIHPLTQSTRKCFAQLCWFFQCLYYRYVSTVLTGSNVTGSWKFALTVISHCQTRLFSQPNCALELGDAVLCTIHGTSFAPVPALQNPRLVVAQLSQSTPEVIAVPRGGDGEAEQEMSSPRVPFVPNKKVLMTKKVLL